MPWDDPKAASLRGHERMKELAAQDAIIIAGNTNRLLAELGRPYTHAERLSVELFCTLLQRATRQQALGRNNLETLREASALLRDLPWLRATQEPVVASPPIAPAD